MKTSHPHPKKKYSGPCRELGCIQYIEGPNSAGYYGLKHRDTVLSVSDRVMQFNDQAAQKKGEKLAHRWLGLYTIMEVHKNGTYTVAVSKGRVRATRCVPAKSTIPLRGMKMMQVYIYVYVCACVYI